MINADYVLIEVGTNEYWEKQSISYSVTGIRRLVNTLKNFYRDNGPKIEPIFVVATPPQSTRSFQNPFLLALADGLLERKETLNVRILFHTLGTSIIGADQLHPDASGYRVMAKLVKKVLNGVVQHQARAARPDQDGDGIYDRFEESKYGTSSSLADTDSDSFIDGDEVFTYETDPLDGASHP